MTMLEVGLKKHMGGVKGKESKSHSRTGRLYECPVCEQRQCSNQHKEDSSEQLYLVYSLFN